MNTNDQVIIGLARLGSVLRAARWRQADAAGLSPIQADILAFLQSRGPQRQTRLAAEMGVTQPTISDALSALGRKVLIEARPDPDDGRARLIHLTVAGMDIAAAVAGSPEVMMDAADALDDTDRASFMRGLVAMIRSLQNSGQIAPQRMCVSCTYFQPNRHSDAVRPHHCAFVDAPFGDADLRVDCGDHREAGAA